MGIKKQELSFTNNKTEATESDNSHNTQRTITHLLIILHGGIMVPGVFSQNEWSAAFRVSLSVLSRFPEK
jgi:hypothetical protein